MKRILRELFSITTIIRSRTTASRTKTVTRIIITWRLTTGAFYCSSRTSSGRRRFGLTPTAISNLSRITLFLSAYTGSITTSFATSILIFWVLLNCCHGQANHRFLFPTIKYQNHLNWPDKALSLGSFF